MPQVSAAFLQHAITVAKSNINSYLSLVEK